MTRRFWLASSGLMAGAVLGGLSLGNYVTHMPLPPRVQRDASIPSATEQNVGAALTGASDGPVSVACTGCGPTLEDRRFAADMAGIDAGDRMDQVSGDADETSDGMTQAAYYTPPSVTAKARPLPGTIERFADGENGPPFVTPTATKAIGQDDAALMIQGAVTP